MKRILLTVSLAGILCACNVPTEGTGNVANCPKPPESPPELIVGENEEFYQRFNYHVRDIVATADTVTFVTSNYDFVFCRGNTSWTVQPATSDSNPSEGKTYEESLAEWANPPYETIQLQGEDYQYRVLLEPNPFPDFQAEANKVIFELIKPTQEQPQRQTLYTLEEMRQAQTGFQLGFPYITAALTYNDQLFWAVSPEQGEGNGGIATIVNYDPTTAEIQVIKPEEIQGQQINDMAIAGEAASPTIWLGTQVSGEGNPYLPGMGLVAYRPDSTNLQSGSVSAYYVRNSPIVGAIPDQLLLEDETLWVGTGNGVCQVDWQAAENPQRWSCWRFALMTQLPNEGILLYESSLAEEPTATLDSSTQGEIVEVLWWSPLDYETRSGRYEVKYDDGIPVRTDQGAVLWPELFGAATQPPVWWSPVYWPGEDWHWEGNRFVRGFDEVALNIFGGGPNGIGSDEVDAEGRQDINAIRGDLELINLSEESTEVKHYSGWVDDRVIAPYLTVVPQDLPQNPQPNPLQSVAETLKFE